MTNVYRHYWHPSINMILSTYFMTNAYHHTDIPQSTWYYWHRYLALAFFAAAIFWFNRKCGTFFKWIGSSFKASREAKNMNYARAIAREEAIRAWIASSPAQQQWWNCLCYSDTVLNYYLTSWTQTCAPIIKLTPSYYVRFVFFTSFLCCMIKSH